MSLDCVNGYRPGGNIPRLVCVRNVPVEDDQLLEILKVVRWRLKHKASTLSRRQPLHNMCHNLRLSFINPKYQRSVSN
jgi:hypothetical protein